MKKRVKNLGPDKSHHDSDSLMVEFCRKAIFKKSPKGFWIWLLYRNILNLATTNLQSQLASPPFMKFVVLFILSFLLVSALPFLWNQFSFVEVGFPFPYLQRMTIEGSEFTSTTISFQRVNFAYDLILVGIFVWVLYKFRTTLKSNTSSKRPFKNLDQWEKP